MPTRPAEQVAPEVWDHGSSQGSSGIGAVSEHTLHGEAGLGKRQETLYLYSYR